MSHWLFREQGIKIASILTATGMAISVLVEVLLPGGGGSKAGGTACKPQPKDENGLKEWIRNKLKALLSLLGQLGAKHCLVSLKQFSTGFPIELQM